MKINQRLFTFGCSFTGYDWPTWADILGKGFKFFENWGRLGGGNQFIFNSLVECHLRNTLTKNDVVCIMWTNVTRIDRYLNNDWALAGNIYTQNQPDLKWMREFSDVRGYYIRDLAILYATDQLLKNIGCKYHFLSMVPMMNVDQYTLADASDNINDFVGLYKETLDKIAPSIFEVVFDYNWRSRPFLPNLAKVRSSYNDVAGPDWPSFEKFIEQDFSNIKPEIVTEILDKNQWDWKKEIEYNQRKDQHATPLEHLEYLTKILPEYPIAQDTKKWVRDIDEAVWLKIPFDHLWNPAIIKRW